jgi:hypothetical protein
MPLTCDFHDCDDPATPRPVLWLRGWPGHDDIYLRLCAKHRQVITPEVGK